MDPMGELLEDDERPPAKPKLARLAAVYGVIIAVAVFFFGWVTGLGGSFGPNLGFSLIMGLFAFAILWVMMKLRSRA